MTNWGSDEVGGRHQGHALPQAQRYGERERQARGLLFLPQSSLPVLLSPPAWGEARANGLKVA